jgi:hypothetical protein
MCITRIARLLGSLSAHTRTGCRTAMCRADLVLNDWAMPH